MDLARVGRFERALRALTSEADVELAPREPVLRALGGGPAPALATTGVVELRGVLAADEARALGDRVRAIVAAGTPAVATFVAPWIQRALARLADAVRGVLPAHEAVADAWVHHVAVGAGNAGWTVHRGVYEEVRDATGEPSLVGAWLALGDATIDNGCMRFVPLDRDPELAAGRPLTRAPTVAAGSIEGLEVAAPLASGDALVWCSHVLHRGGPSSARAGSPRTSLSLSLARSGTWTHLRRLPREVGDDERLAILADLVDAYAEAEAGLGDDAREWARAAAAMRR